MTDKELQKLGRRELLQLLLNQAQEADRLSLELAEISEQLRQKEEAYERLRERLDHKDAQIHELRATIQEERDKREVDMHEVGSIAEAALRLNGIFDAAQQAADLYLKKVQERYPLPESGFLLEPSMSAGPAQEEARVFFAEKPDQAEAVRPVLDLENDPILDDVEPIPEEETSFPKPQNRTGPSHLAESSMKKLPFRTKKRKNKGRLTLSFGWEHD